MDSPNYSLPLFYEKDDVESYSVIDDGPISLKRRIVTCDTIPGHGPGSYDKTGMSVDEKLGLDSVSLYVEATFLGVPLLDYSPVGLEKLK
jgi:hypothetical protein